MIINKVYINILKMLYGTKQGISIGKGTTFRKRFYLYVGREGSITIGENSFFNHNFSAYSYRNIRIGDNCIFGENVKIYDHNHRFNDKNKLIKNQGFSIAAIEIGNNVWVGSNAVILKGCKIGDNCVIGAGTVVSGAIPAGTIVKTGNIITEKIRFH